MADRHQSDESEPSPDRLRETLEELENTGRGMAPALAAVVGGIAALWSLFQLWIASPLPFALGIGIIVDVPARGVHLAFGLVLCFLLFPISKRLRRADGLPLYDVALAILGCGAALYLFLGYDGLVARRGILLTYDLSLFGWEFAFPFEAVIGGIGILLLLEATRRSIGIPLVIVAGVFLVYSIFGQSMPEIVSHKGVSIERLIGYQWMGGEAVFGIPIDVSVSFVFLFVLFGALLDKAGAGQYFLDLSFALVGRYRGGPAKAAILASGMTGMISGSSIANVVTTGTFTIPVMRRTGLPAVKAGAIEVAASTNGQIMPPIMGAAAFIIAEFIGISYFDVVVAAALPAAISYMALFYISHLEALKLGLTGLPRADIPHLRRTFFRGVHFLTPIVVLVYLLMVERWTAGSAVFWSIVLLMAIIVAQHAVAAATGGERGIGRAIVDGVVAIYEGLVSGARNMVNIAVAVAVAGIIVGAVSSTGLNNAMIGVVEAISGGNIYVLLLLTAVVCIILGMGLPTTANYIVVASLMAGVVVELGNASGLVLPLIAVHLYVFYFGLMADSTPPVCLAAFAASAISGADPLRTGVQSFLYDIRTAILPLVFVFNPELLLIGVESVGHGVLVFAVSLIAILSFSSLTQGWLLVRLRIYEGVLLVLVIAALFRPDFVLDLVKPEFRSVGIAEAQAVPSAIPEDRKIRLHAVRSTNYGDRYKLFAISPPPPEGEQSLARRIGVELAPAEGGGYEVSNVAFEGPAEKAGLAFGDRITEIDVAQIDRPPKEIVYPFGLAVLALVLLSQWRRRRAA